MSLIFYKSNLLDQALIYPKDENRLFPANNLKDSRKTKVYRSLDSQTYIDIDLRETSIIDAVMLFASKRSGLGFNQAIIHFNNVPDFTNPAVTRAAEISTKFGIGLVEFSDSIEYRFMRIELESTLDYCELSGVFVGEKMNLNRSINFGWQWKDVEISNSQTNTEGQEFFDKISKQQQISFSFSLLTRNESDFFQELFDDVGEVKPVYVLMGENVVVSRLRHSGAFLFDKTPAITNTSFNRFAFSAVIKEVL